MKGKSRLLACSSTIYMNNCGGSKLLVSAYSLNERIFFLSYTYMAVDGEVGWFSFELDTFSAIYFMRIFMLVYPSPTIYCQTLTKSMYIIIYQPSIITVV